jgi:hypothetical protein
MNCKICEEDIGTGKGFICRICKELRTKYGMTRLDRNALMEEQANKCKICGKLIQTDERRKADTCNVDHCHTTEEETGRFLVRGLLCMACNKDLGGYERMVARGPFLKEYLKGGKEFGGYTDHRLKTIESKK